MQSVNPPIREAKTWKARRLLAHSCECRAHVFICKRPKDRRTDTLSVRESFRPKPGAISTVYGRGEMIDVRGKLTPLLRLHDYFAVEPKTTDPTEAIVIVIESGRDTRCLMVDELIGKQEVVIKSLGETFGEHPALAGAAILGDGRVGLILNTDSLVRMKAPTPFPTNRSAAPKERAA